MSDVETVARLQAQFGVGAQIVVQTGKGGLPEVRINTPLCTAAISLQGAHLTSFVPAGGQELIFLSKEAVFAKGVPLRGGVPVCWPWFGDHLTDAAAPAHGFARRRTWQLQQTGILDDGTAHVVLGLQVAQGSEPGFAGGAEVTLTVEAGKGLALVLETNNTGEVAFELSQALHTYFRVGDAGRVALVGLDGRTYQDDVDGQAEKVQTGPVTFSGEVDRIYKGVEGRCEILDPAIGRKIAIDKSGSETAVVWNPWSVRAVPMKDMGNDEFWEMVCVEAVNTLSDSPRLAPGASHTLAQRISIQML